jgi:tetratricopeptide (TPR) repeat protein
MDPSAHGLCTFWAAIVHVLASRADRALEICDVLTAQPGTARVYGLCCRIDLLAILGRADEAAPIADEAMSARAHANPFLVAYVHYGYGRVFALRDPSKALNALREGLTYTHDHPVPHMEAVIARDATHMEALHGDPDQALALFDTTIDFLHQSGDVGNLAATLANLAIVLDRFGQPEIAATVYGSTTGHDARDAVISLPGLVDHLRAQLGKPLFDESVAAGATMAIPEAVHYARGAIATAESSSPRPEGSAPAAKAPAMARSQPQTCDPRLQPFRQGAMVAEYCAGTTMPGGDQTR